MGCGYCRMVVLCLLWVFERRCLVCCNRIRYVVVCWMGCSLLVLGFVSFLKCGRWLVYLGKPDLRRCRYYGGSCKETSRRGLACSWNGFLVGVLLC